jgi:hypothetical protein
MSDRRDTAQKPNYSICETSQLGNIASARDNSRQAAMAVVHLNNSSATGWQLAALIVTSLVEATLIDGPYRCSFGRCNQVSTLSPFDRTRQVFGLFK